MKVSGKALTTILSLVCLSLCASDEGQNIEVSTFVDAKPLERKPPVYPKEGLYDSREAWVLLYFVVNEEGSVSDINVFDSLGGTTFERTAMNALREYKYVPATQDGVPISSSRVLKFNFEFEPHAKGASFGFRSEQRRFQKHVTEKSRESADKSLQELRRKAKNLYEFAWLAFAEFTYHREWGTKTDQLKALEHAVAYEHTARYLPEEAFVSALASQIVLQVQLSYFQGALTSYRRFVNLQAPKSQFESALATYMERVQEIKDKRTPFAKTDQFDKLGRWSYRLLWNTFTIEPAEKPTSDLMLRCDKKSVAFPYEPDIRYEIPDSAGDCALFLEGSPNTEITLYQL